jgi:hypothetical protein
MASVRSINGTARARVVNLREAGAKEVQHAR